MHYTFDFNCPTHIIFGSGKFNEIETVELPGKKALVVHSADNIAEKYGYLGSLTAMLDKRGVSYVLYNNVQSNPIIENVMLGAALARNNKCDFIIGLGGGSVLDAAKAISLMATNEGDYWDYIDCKLEIKNPRLPVITISTLAGTGTEIAPFFVITNEERNEKVGFPKPMRYNTWPVIAIIDPVLMCTVPPEHTAYAGFDAFSHCAESYISNKANMASDMYSLACLEAVKNGLERAIRNGNDVEARSLIAYASICSGVVMSVGSSGSKHSLEHAMSAFHNELPHGAGLLMICIAYYRKIISKHVVDNRFIEMAKVLGFLDADKPEDFLTVLSELMKKCGVDNLKMSDYGISPSEFPKFVNNARTTSIGYLFGSDSAVLTDEDCLDIYRESYK